MLSVGNAPSVNKTHFQRSTSNTPTRRLAILSQMQTFPSTFARRCGSLEQITMESVQTGVLEPLSREEKEFPVWDWPCNCSKSPMLHHPQSILLNAKAVYTQTKISAVKWHFMFLFSFRQEELWVRDLTVGQQPHPSLVALSFCWRWNRCSLSHFVMCGKVPPCPFMDL